MSKVHNEGADVPKSDNELIAEFMGGTKQIIPIGGMYGYKEGTVLWRNLFNEDDSPLNYLDFDTSWDWLMPVVEKIGNLWEPLSPLTNSVERVTSLPIGSPIKNIHAEVVNFIKWYSQQPKL